MNSVDLVRRLHTHRAWVNKNLLDAARQLDDAQLRREFLIGQGSVWKTLLHMYGAEYAWLASLEGDHDPLVPGDIAGKIPGNQLADGAIQSLPELESCWAELETRWGNYFETLTPQALEATIYKKSFLTGSKLWGTNCADVLMHVATHAHYTTAQTINMFRQLGVEKLPAVMLIALARLETTPIDA